MPNALLARSAKTVFGLACDIQRSCSTKSGFEPAQYDLGAGKELFGTQRLTGFAALLKIGFADELVIMGGDEARYENEIPVVNRAEAIREILIHDFDCPESQIKAFASNSNTGGNIDIIKREVAARSLASNDFAVVSSHYHIPRASIDLIAAGLTCALYPAEAFIFLLRDNKNELIANFGEGPLAERVVEEIQGIAHKIRGTYKPRTDVAATPLKTKARTN